ncbi:hypothetical protein [Aquimarina macrocephali]|uniref:hypothetical protein n=1 Tax=Aquimarina macrocephali TaxID=666563 RepID=UPI003F666FC1
MTKVKFWVRVAGLLVTKTEISAAEKLVMEVSVMQDNANLMDIAYISKIKSRNYSFL